MAQLNVELIVRKGTAEEWAGSSYVLKAGEWGYDTTNKIAKIGDGTSLWAALPRTGVTYTLQAGDANGEIKLVGADGSSSSAKVTGLGALAYKGTVAEVTRVLPKENKVVVEGVNIIKKHMKPTQQDPDGKIIEREAPIHVSNVMAYDSKAKTASRIGYKIEDGKKVRVYKKTGNIVK